MMKVGVDIKNRMTASAYMKGLTIIRDCEVDPSPPLLYGAVQITDSGIENFFSGWYLTYDGNTVVSDDWQTFCQSMGGNRQFGTDTNGQTARLYVKVLSLATPILIFNASDVQVGSISSLQDEPDQCLTFTVTNGGSDVNLDSTLQNVGEGDPSITSVLYPDPATAANMTDMSTFETEFLAFVQAVYGNATSTVSIDVQPTEIIFTINHVFAYPQQWIFTNQTGGVYASNSAVCP